MPGLEGFTSRQSSSAATQVTKHDEPLMGTAIRHWPCVSSEQEVSLEGEEEENDLFARRR